MEGPSCCEEENRWNRRHNTHALTAMQLVHTETGSGESVGFFIIWSTSTSILEPEHNHFSNQVPDWSGKALRGLGPPPNSSFPPSCLCTFLFTPDTHLLNLISSASIDASTKETCVVPSRLEKNNIQRPCVTYRS